MIISAPLITSWKRSVKFGLSSLARAKGDKLIGWSTKNTGLSELDALKAITINAAEIVNIQDKVGSIEKGKDADIVIFDKSALFSDSKCLYTIINGEIVHRL